MDNKVPDAGLGLFNASVTLPVAMENKKVPKVEALKATLNSVGLIWVSMEGKLPVPPEKIMSVFAKPVTASLKIIFKGIILFGVGLGAVVVMVATGPVASHVKLYVAAMLPVDVLSSATLACISTFDNPSALAVRVKVYFNVFTAVKAETTPFVTTRSLCVKPVTASLKLTVIVFEFVKDGSLPVALNKIVGFAST